VDRHEVDGAKVLLYAGDDRFEVNASQVRGYEVEDYTPPPSAAVPPAIELAPAALTPAELGDQAADRYGLPRALVRSVMSAESNLDARAVSPKGAIGLMQLMPATARELGTDPYDPALNVDAGVRHLRDLVVKYRGGLWHALAAYNAGPGAVEKYGGPPPYSETIDYINRINRGMKKNP
jgi:soluble lytic murein transglycosylase-like protein